MEFKLNKTEIKTLDIWQESIKKVFGRYGSYSFTFTPTGIASKIEVYSDLLKETKDITDYDSW